MELDPDPSCNGLSPMFLLSTERSGSNLVRSILNTHPDISAPHPLETGYPWGKVTSPHEMGEGAARKLIRDVVINKNYSYHPLEVPMDVDSVYDVWRRQPPHSLLSLQKALYTECTRREGNSGWVSKYPALWKCLDGIEEFYEEPRFIYLVRDPRDVVLSFKTSNVGRYHPYFNTERWREEQERGIEFLERHEDRIHLIRYQDLLKDPEGEVKSLCETIGFSYEPEMLFYYETESAKVASEKAEAFSNLSSPIKSDNYDKFYDRLPYREIKITEKVAMEEMEYFGFEPVHSREELENFELNIEKYEEEDQRLDREATVTEWSDNPREEFKKQVTRSFAGYMVLRYGILK